MMLLPFLNAETAQFLHCTVSAKKEKIEKKQFKDVPIFPGGTHPSEGIYCRIGPFHRTL